MSPRERRGPFEKSGIFAAEGRVRRISCGWQQPLSVALLSLLSHPVYSLALSMAFSSYLLEPEEPDVEVSVFIAGYGFECEASPVDGMLIRYTFLGVH